MNNDDLLNDAIDAQIQSVIDRSRGNTLRGMMQAPGVGQPEDDLADEGTLAMIAEDEEEQAKKAQGGGGIAGALGGILGG